MFKDPLTQILVGAIATIVMLSTVFLFAKNGLDFDTCSMVTVQTATLTTLKECGILVAPE